MDNLMISDYGHQDQVQVFGQKCQVIAKQDVVT